MSYFRSNVLFFIDLTRIARTGSGIGSGTDCANATESALASGIARGTDTVRGRAAATEADGRRTTEVAAETDRTENGAGSAIVTRIDIGIGKGKKKYQRRLHLTSQVRD